MEKREQRRCGAWKEAAGFTLPEVLITIVLIGIVMAIASSSWFGLVDSRRVTSDTNQFAADLRLAHSKATNQLREYAVVTDPSVFSGLTGSADYYIVPLLPSGLPDIPNVKQRNLDDSGRTEIDVDFGAKFKPDGSADPVGSPALATTTTISLDDGGVAANPKHTIDLVPATSRIKID